MRKTLANDDWLTPTTPTTPTTPPPATPITLQLPPSQPGWSRYHCPAWCGGHDESSLSRAVDEQQLVHCAGIGGGHLDRLANSYSGQVLRDEQVSYDVAATMAETASGVRLGEFVQLDISTGPGVHERAELNLTPGEARSMAAVLIAGADRLDVAHGTNPNLYRFERGRAEHVDVFEGIRDSNLDGFWPDRPIGSDS